MCLDDIRDGLNFVVGPNEMGKSTLLDALRAALFDKYSSKAQPIRALQNDRNRAAPVVRLAFEVDDETYRIRKRFVKRSYAQFFCLDGRKLEAMQETLACLLSGEQDERDKDELHTAQTRRGEISDLETRIEAAAIDAELKKLNLEQAEQILAQCLSMDEQLTTDAAAVEAAKENLNKVREKDQKLRNQVEGLRKDAKKAEDAATEADDAESRARGVLTAVQREGRIRELQDRYEKAHKAEKKQRAAQQGAAVILVTDENIEVIRDAARKLETARSRLSAAATLVAFHMPTDRLSKVEVDGAALSAGQSSVKAVQGRTITIPDYGTISVQPAIKDRDRLIAQQRKASDALTAALGECDVK